MSSDEKKSKLKDQFAKLDKNGDGCLELSELQELLGKGQKGMAKSEVLKLFNQVDKDGNGTVNFNEFVDYIYSISAPADPRTSAGRNAKLKAAGAVNDEGDDALWPQVKEVFTRFVGDDCDNKEFNKMLKDCGLYNRKFKATQADLIFSKVCRGARRMDFAMFKAAVGEVGKGRESGTTVVQESIIETGGPEFKGTKADNVRFHDDKSTYTGAHVYNEKHGHAGGAERGTDARHERLAEKAKADDLGDEALWQCMSDVFTGFCGEECDNREFAKLCKECGLYDKKFKNTDADIIFEHVKKGDKKKRKINYEDFKEAIGQIAEKKGCPTAEVQRQIQETGGPKWSGTKADAVRFHDDKSTYTGAHTHNEKHGSELGGHDRNSEDRQKRLSAQTHDVDPGDESLYADVDQVFENFFGKDCDGKEFVKMLKDCNLMDGNFDTTKADLVFASVKPHNGRRIDQTHFREALGQIAKHKKCTTKEVQDALIAKGEPTYQGTEAEYNRFHDDKSTYTGTHYGK